MVNPPAFPNTGNKGIKPASGMSLRDWYIGQALAGLCANNNYIASASWSAAPDKMVSDRACAIADAVLIARTQESTPC